MIRTLLSFGISGVILLVIAVDTWGYRWLAAPWSFDTSGPTLTGVWQGALRARQGAEYRLYLDLHYQMISRRRPWDENLGGRAIICTRHGALYEYAVSGDADRQGRNIVLTMKYDDPALSALDIRLTGDWNGETITLTPRNNPFLPDGRFIWPRPVSAADPDDGFAPTLLRSSDEMNFMLACGRLAQ